MNIHCLQHSSVNTLGTVEEYAETRKALLESTRFYETASSPTLDSFDLLIIMGGAIGIYDYEKNPWLKTEKEFIKETINAGKPVLGICLGAQLLADVLGAKVFENGHREMGWFSVKACPEGKEKEQEKSEFLTGLPETFSAFHWHSQTFDIPEGAIRLFESEGCKNHAFIYGDRVLALQFHPEVNEERIGSLIERFGTEIAEGPFILQKEKMLGQTESLFESKKFLYSVLDKFESQL
ncbi:MAG: type 1 glutamine amidotransferase [Methanosarcinaceae archaeon]|nr:type 1 glutamine amidotransferase [Methanosarcinaceae archaeon]